METKNITKNFLVNGETSYLIPFVDGALELFVYSGDRYDLSCYYNRRLIKVSYDFDANEFDNLMQNIEANCTFCKKEIFINEVF